MVRGKCRNYSLIPRIKSHLFLLGDSFDELCVDRPSMYFLIDFKCSINDPRFSHVIEFGTIQIECHKALYCFKYLSLAHKVLNLLFMFRKDGIIPNLRNLLLWGLEPDYGGLLLP